MTTTSIKTDKVPSLGELLKLQEALEQTMAPFEKKLIKAAPDVFHRILSLPQTVSPLPDTNSYAMFGIKVIEDRTLPAGHYRLTTEKEFHESQNPR